jgi:hypothetical protein
VSNDINSTENAKMATDSGPAFHVAVTLSGAAIDVLHQLFLNGPTWDGDVASKSGRDELYDLKLIGRHEGYQFILREGMRLALANRLDAKKNRRDRDQRRRLNEYDQICALVRSRDVAAAISGIAGCAEQDQQQAVRS